MNAKSLRWAAVLAAVLAGRGWISAEAPNSATSPIIPSATLGRPIAVCQPVAVLQRPVVVPEAPVPPSDLPQAPVMPVSYQEPGVVARGQQADGPYQTLYQPSAPPPPAPDGGAVPAPFGAPADGYNPNATYGEPVGGGHSFWDKCHDWFGGSNGQHGFHCESDKQFESMITPVSNPFFFEDPRAVTEVRPLFLFETSPHSNGIFGGGDALFYGLQGRLALNDRWSIVINKLGIVTFDPKDPADGVDNRTGFAEFNLGPKFTFLHNTTTNTVAAAGVNFDLPIGSRDVLQNTGALSIDPYFTIGHTFGQTSWGQFNIISTTGFNFSVNDERSDFFHTALHLDFDIARAHKWFPLVEVNWFHYTSGGRATDLGFEGLDLANFGSSGITGHDDLSMATGVRYKFNDHCQFGIAAQWPLIRPENIQDFRLTVDMIFRY